MSKRYKVRLSPHSSHTVSASSPTQARQKVWDYIKGGYTYGWTKAKFLRDANTELVK